MTEKTENAVARVDRGQAARLGGNVALVTTVHKGLDRVVAPDGRLIIGVSQRPGEDPRTLNLKTAVAEATDIVAQPGPDARRAYGEVLVVVARPDGKGGFRPQTALIDYPNKRIITNPGEANQHVRSAAGLPQAFTTNQPYSFVQAGGDPSKPSTSNGVVVAAYMHAPVEGSAIPTFNPAALARGDLTHLTHAFFEPAGPLAGQTTQQAFVATVDPIAAASAAAQRVMLGQQGGNGPRAIS